MIGNTAKAENLTCMHIIMPKSLANIFGVNTAVNVHQGNFKLGIDSDQTHHDISS